MSTMAYLRAKFCPEIMRKLGAGQTGPSTSRTSEARSASTSEYARSELAKRHLEFSSGTFVNGVRLSEEGASSEQHLLENDDQIDFGVDILKDDNEGALTERSLCFLQLADD